jgi:hypothetical protein
MSSTRHYENEATSSWIAKLGSFIVDYFDSSCTAKVDNIQCGSDDHSLDDITVFTPYTISTVYTMEPNDEEASQLQPRIVMIGRLHSKVPSVATAPEDVRLHSNAPSVETTPGETKPLECATPQVDTIRDDTATLELSTPFQVQSKGVESNQFVPAASSENEDEQEELPFDWSTRTLETSAFQGDKNLIVQGLARCRAIQRKYHPRRSPGEPKAFKNLPLRRELTAKVSKRKPPNVQKAMSRRRRTTSSADPCVGLCLLADSAS